MTEHCDSDERRDGHERRADTVSLSADDSKRFIETLREVLLSAGGSCWQIDKKIGMGVLIMLFFNVAYGFWYAGKQDNKVEVIQSRLISLEQRLDDRTEREDRQFERVVSMESDIKWIKSRLAQDGGR